jgi:hypothetical protein
MCLLPAASISPPSFYHFALTAASLPVTAGRPHAGACSAAVPTWWNPRPTSSTTLILNIVATTTTSISVPAHDARPSSYALHRYQHFYFCARPACFDHLVFAMDQRTSPAKSALSEAHEHHEHVELWASKLELQAVHCPAQSALLVSPVIEPSAPR